jgi:molybdopterin synthase catalytic subunit
MAKTWIDLVWGPISTAAVREFVGGDSALGGLVIFEGVTRSESDPDHGGLRRLDYEAYESMARSQLERIANQAAERFGAQRIAIVHRLGPVQPGETSVMIALACKHRGEAFDACRWLIDTLKQDIPIWKKDVFEDGFVRWVKDNANCQLPIANWNAGASD